MPEFLPSRIQAAIDQLTAAGMELPFDSPRETTIAEPTNRDVTQAIEHTLLKPEATRDQVFALCDEARQFGFCGVCVNPVFVGDARRRLEGSGCRVVTVAGFPLGASQTKVKAAEARAAVESGADEVDMVLHVGGLKSHDGSAVVDDVRAVVEAAGAAAVKVILENCLLSDDERIRACLLVAAGGAAFVKTSTGFGVSGATVEDVRLMRTVVGDTLGVKAAGGIRSLSTAKNMLAAGANRLGCSASVAIQQEIGGG